MRDRHKMRHEDLLQCNQINLLWAKFLADNELLASFNSSEGKLVLTQESDTDVTDVVEISFTIDDYQE